MKGNNAHKLFGIALSLAVVAVVLLLAVAVCGVAMAQTQDPQVVVSPYGLPCELNAIVGVISPCNEPNQRGAMVHIKSSDTAIVAYMVTLYWTDVDGKQHSETRLADIGQNGWGNVAFPIGTLPYQTATLNIPGNIVTKTIVKGLKDVWTVER